MICPNEDELGGYLNQELAPERLAAVEDHVGDCLRCQGLLELLVRRESPRELLRELGPAPRRTGSFTRWNTSRPGAARPTGG